MLRNPAPKRRWLSLPDGWDAGYKTALQGAGAAPLKVVCFGDSITLGVKASDWNATAWPGLLRAYLIARNAGGQGADYHPTLESQTMVSGYTWAGTPPWVVNNTNRSHFVQVLGDCPVYTDTGVAAKLVWTAIDGDVTELEILYLDYSASTWDYACKDAGGNVVTSGTVTTAGTILYKKLSLTGLATPVHTVEIGNQSVSQRMQIAGIIAYQNRSRGLQFAKLGMSGLGLTAFSPTGGIPVDNVIPWQGTYAGGATGLGFPAAPDLFLLAFGVNDCQTSGRYVRCYEATMERLCRALRRGNPNVSILMLAMHLPDGDNSDMAATGLTNTYSYPLYLARMRRVAETFGAGFVNIHAKWGETAVAQGFVASNDLHPNDAGNADIFAALKLAGL